MHPLNEFLLKLGLFAKKPWKFNASRVSFLFGAGRKSQFVEYLWNDDQINGAVVIFLKVIYINIIIDYCVQRQVDLIYMTPEYMAELHKFIYMSKDSDVDRLKEKVGNHLKYIPKRKLYRYRKCIDRELNLIEENAVWISNPDTFADPFDSTIPVQELEDVDFYYPFLTGFEIAYIQKYIEIFRNSNIKQPARHYTRRLFLHLIDYGRIAN